MKAGRILARAAAVLAAAALLVPTLPHAAGAHERNRSDSVTISVDSITPSTPSPTQTRERLTVTLTLTNTTGGPLNQVSVLGERGDPIALQKTLEESLANPTPPSSGVEIPAHPAVIVKNLPRGSSQTVTFTTRTSTLDDGQGLCICATAQQPLIYPLFFSAHVVANGVDQLLGVTSTYVPAFYAKAKQLHVSWIWPLLERPHRLSGDTEFTDDLLATSVDTGRLSRALEVVERVAAQPGPPIPLTLLVDPELLDELEVMADTTTPYTVASGGGKPVAGSGQAAARAWLDRFGLLLESNPQIQVQLTAYGDPDVEALTERGLRWSSGMPAVTDMAARVSQALAGRPPESTLAWPVSGRIGAPTLHALARHGVNTVVLNGTAVGPTAGTAIAPGLARLPGIGGQNVIAALTSPTVERYVDKAVTVDGSGAAALPRLIADLAVRVTQEPDVEHALTITAPRYVDPNVDAAVRTITDTSNSTFATPISLSAATVDSSLIPTPTSHLAATHAAAAASAPPTLDAAANAAERRAAIASLLDEHDAGARAFEQALPIAVQRCQSSAWRSPQNAAAAADYAASLDESVSGILDGVRLVSPTSGSYTLASNTSPLPITVDNELPYPVWIRINVDTVTNDQPGFSAKDIGRKLVEANQKHTFNIPVTVDYSGRLRIQATLTTPNDVQLGSAVDMRVRSTALGLIGVVITIVAGVVLGLALLWRVLRRLHARRVPDAPPADALAVDLPEPIS